MTLRTTQAGLTLLSTFEATKLRGYLCPAGVATIGRGVTTEALRDAKQAITYTDGTVADRVIVGKHITPEEEQRLFKALVDDFENEVERLIKGAKVNVVEPCEFDAMTSLSWNIGKPSFARSSVLKLYRRGDKRGAAEAMLAWNKARVKGQLVVLKGLVRRRNAERALFLGDYKAAGALAGANLGAMPQRVEPPAKREPVLQSPTGNAQLGIGGAGAAVAIEGARQAVESAGQVRDTARSAGELFGLSGSTAVLIGLGLVIFGLAAFAWWRRFRRSQVEDRVDLEGAVDVTAAMP
jgi:lysozyme